MSSKGPGIQIQEVLRGAIDRVRVPSSLLKVAVQQRFVVPGNDACGRRVSVDDLIETKLILEKPPNGLVVMGRDRGRATTRPLPCGATGKSLTSLAEGFPSVGQIVLV